MFELGDPLISSLDDVVEVWSLDGVISISFPKFVLTVVFVPLSLNFSFKADKERTSAIVD